MRIANCAIHNNQTSNQLYADLCVENGFQKTDFTIQMELQSIHVFIYNLFFQSFIS